MRENHAKMTFVSADFRAILLNQPNVGTVRKDICVQNLTTKMTSNVINDVTQMMQPPVIHLSTALLMIAELLFVFLQQNVQLPVAVSHL